MDCLCFVGSKNDDILTKPDVTEKSPHHIQHLPSTSEGKFNMHVDSVIIYREYFNIVLNLEFKTLSTEKTKSSHHVALTAKSKLYSTLHYIVEKVLMNYL